VSLHPNWAGEPAVTDGCPWSRPTPAARAGQLPERTPCSPDQERRLSFRVINRRPAVSGAGRLAWFLSACARSPACPDADLQTWNSLRLSLSAKPEIGLTERRSGASRTFARPAPIRCPCPRGGSRLPVKLDSAGAKPDRTSCYEQHRTNTSPVAGKTNTPITRTNRHSPVHGGTIDRISVYAHWPAAMRVSWADLFLADDSFRRDRPSVNRQVIGSSPIAGATRSSRRQPSHLR
jgi:hypothetical protein